MKKRVWLIFWLLVGLFVGLVVAAGLRVAFSSLRGVVAESVVIGLVDALAVLGGVLIYLVVKERPMRRLKRFLLVTGASAVGIPVSAVLYDVAFFFVVAMFVCPIAFVVGAIGTGLTVRKRTSVKEIANAK